MLESAIQQFTLSMIETSKNKSFLSSVERIQNNPSEWPGFWMRTVLSDTDLEKEEAFYTYERLCDVKANEEFILRLKEHLKQCDRKKDFILMIATFPLNKKEFLLRTTVNSLIAENVVWREFKINHL